MAGAAYTAPTIAITGSPKDYTGLIAARQRQEKADKAKSDAEGRKQNEEIKKALYVSPDKFLPFRRGEVTDALADAFQKINQARADGDFSAENEAMSSIKMLLADRADEKKKYDEAEKGLSTGTYIAGGDLKRVSSAKSVDELQDLVEQGAISVEPNSGRLNFNVAKNVNFENLWKGLAANYERTNTGEVVKGADGTEFFKMKYDLDGYKQGLGITFDNNPNVQEKAAIIFKNSHPDEVANLSPEELMPRVRQEFITNGLAFAQQDDLKNKPGKGGITINVDARSGSGNGDQPATPFGEYAKTSTIAVANPITKETQTYEANNYGGYSSGDFKMTGTLNPNSIYSDTGKKIDDALVRKSTFNNFFVRVLLNEEVKLPNGTTYPKGSSIPRRYEPLVIKRGLGRAAIIANGLTENNESISVDATGINPSAYTAATEKEKEQLIVEYKAAAEERKKLETEIKEKSKKSPASTSTTKPAVDKEKDKAKAAKADAIAKQRGMPTF